MLGDTMAVLGTVPSPRRPPAVPGCGGGAQNRAGGPAPLAFINTDEATGPPLGNLHVTLHLHPPPGSQFFPFHPSTGAVPGRKGQAARLEAGRRGCLLLPLRSPDLSQR